MTGKNKVISRPNFKTNKNKFKIGLILISKLDSINLNAFLKKMLSFIIKSNNNYTIYIIDEDQPIINIAKLYNIGVLISKKDGCDYIIFHNENIIPDQTLFSYYESYPIDPVFISYHMKEIKIPILSISIIEFENNEGFLMNTSSFINKFFNKLKQFNININIPSSGSFELLENNTIYNTPKINNKNDLNYTNLKYEILEHQIINDSTIYYKIN